jgi:hypothetical protein
MESGQGNTFEENMAAMEARFTFMAGRQVPPPQQDAGPGVHVPRNYAPMYVFEPGSNPTFLVNQGQVMLGGAAPALQRPVQNPVPAPSPAQSAQPQPQRQHKPQAEVELKGGLNASKYCPNEDAKTESQTQ